MAIPVATTRSSQINYVGEFAQPVALEFETQVAEVVVQGWDVEDSDARRIAAEGQLGEGANEDEWYSHHAMWFVNPSDNSAVLVVFRPKVSGGG